MKKAFPWLRHKAESEDVSQEVCRGEKVLIRKKRLDDAGDDFAWRVDEELARLDATTPLMMPYEAFLKFTRDELTYSSSSSQRLAIDTLDGHHIGNCMYYDINLSRGEAELGIMIGNREYWSKGYGVDAVDTLLTHIFTATTLNRVYLHTLDWNHRARRAFARSGFRQVKEIRRSGLDFILMEIRRPEWKRRRVLEVKDASPSQHLSQVDGLVPDEGPAAAAVDP